MNTVLELIGLWIGINVLAMLIMIIIVPEGGNLSFVNPKVIYKKIKVNWFGAWFLAIIFNITLPILSVPYWIYKIFTIGRK